MTVLTLTHGEGSTLGVTDAIDLAHARAQELEASLRALGIERRLLLDLPDGGLDALPADELVGAISHVLRERRPEVLVTYHWNGITGHPDHRRTTWAVVRAARDAVQALPGYCVTLFFWALPATVTAALREHHAVELPAVAEDLLVTVDARPGRSAQDRAMAAHASQGGAGPTIATRLAIQGGREYFVVRTLDGDTRDLAQLGLPEADPAGSCEAVADTC